MKTYSQFITEARELDESKVKLAKIAFKGIKKLGKKLFKKAPKRSIDPYFAQKAVERGTMVRGFHGQSAKNIARYKKTGVTPAVSGVNMDVMKQYKNNPATLDWIKKSGWKPKGNQARPGVDAYFATGTKEGKRQAGLYAKRGARFENEKLKNVLNPFKKKDKGEVMDVVVNKKSIRKGWKDLRNAGTETERIAKAKDIIPVVPGPSAKVGKYRLTQQLRKDRLLKKIKEQWTPKGTFNKPPTNDLTDFLRYKDDIDFEKKEFKRVTGIPLAKKNSKKKIKTT